MNKDNIERNVQAIRQAMMKAITELGIEYTELDIEYIELMSRLGCKNFRMYRV